MNILGKIWIGFCWLWVGLFLLGVPGGVLMYFTEPDVTFFESIGMAIIFIPLAWVFYAIGPKKIRDKRILEMKAIADRATQKKAAEEKKAREKEEEATLIQEMLEMINQGSDYNLVENKMRVFKHHKNSENLKKIENYISKGHEAKKKAAEEKKAKEEKEEEDRIRALCDDEDQFKSYKKGKICLGMHIEVVQEIKGYKYDEKRNISPDKETYKYKYGKFTTSRGNKRYKLEVTYENDRVVSFKDL